MRLEVNEYALYKGDTFVDLGTMSHLSKVTGKSSDTLRFLSTPTYISALAKTTRTAAMVVIKIEEE
jgi:hypothetical protein